MFDMCYIYNVYKTFRYSKLGTTESALLIMAKATTAI
jgi:hypothetical protein